MTSRVANAQTIAVVDYGMGNLHSVASALEHVAPDAKVIVSADRELINGADRILFPGVGAIKDCMSEIRRCGFDQLVTEAVTSGKPVLGICVGMQSLMTMSEENGGVEGLGLFDGQVKFFGEPLVDAQGVKLKVPHMGWNQVAQTPHALWQGIGDNERFYFVHSYCVEADNSDEVVGHCDYGVRFAAALARDNLFAVQFHPEKSHTAGLQLLRNFMQWQPQ